MWTHVRCDWIDACCTAVYVWLQSYMTHEVHMSSFLCAMWLIHSWYEGPFWSSHVHLCEVTGTRDSVLSHICRWVMSYVWMSHLSHVIRMNESFHTFESYKSFESCHTYELVIWVIWVIWVMSFVWMNHLSHAIRTNESFHTWKWVMSGWSYYTCEFVTSHI